MGLLCWAGMKAFERKEDDSDAALELQNKKVIGGRKAGTIDRNRKEVRLLFILAHPLAVHGSLLQQPHTSCSLLDASVSFSVCQHFKARCMSCCSNNAPCKLILPCGRLSFVAKALTRTKI